MFYSFSNFQKMFWAGVSFYSNFIDSFSKAAYYWLIKISWKHHGSWVKNISKKSYSVKRERNFFVKWKSSYKNIQYSSHLLPCILLCKFISWTSRKTIMPNNIFFPSIKHSRDSHRGISTTSNVSFKLRRTWSCLKYVLSISY